MITPLGKELRKFRIDHGYLLKDMADGIGVSSAFLSAIETGRKSPPADFVARVHRWHALSLTEQSTIVRAIDRSATEARLKFPEGLSDEDRETASVLARQFGTLSSDDFRELRALLGRRRA